LPLPSEVNEGIVPAAAVSTDDEFNGWYRCGFYERELIFRSMFHVDHKVDVMSAIHVGVAAAEIDSSMAPLARGSAEIWVIETAPQSSGLTVLPAFRGPLTGLDFVRDRLGDFPILMFNPCLQARHGLTLSASIVGGLRLIDENGSDAVAFRYWETRAVGENISEETPRLQGCELLVRPDIFERLKKSSPQPPLTFLVRLTSREDLDETDNKHSNEELSETPLRAEKNDSTNRSVEEGNSFVNEASRLRREDSRVIRT